MSAAELLRTLVGALEEAAIPYALAGSIASMTYGEPRATLDIDVVVALGSGQLDRFLRLFPSPEFYVDRDAAARAIEGGGQFNVIHPSSGMKIDFFVVGDEVERSQIARRQRRLALPELEAAFSPPEELVVKKLQYYRAGGSDKHLRDIAAMLAISPGEIDLARVEMLTKELGLSELWQVVRRRVEGS